MQIPLSIVPAKSKAGEASAWFIAGRDPLAWLAELTKWNVALDSLLLLPIPQSTKSPAATGVLVMNSHTDSRGRTAPLTVDPNLRSVNVFSYAQIGGCLFVPTDSQFAPAIADAELISLLPATNENYVWHPSAGLIRIELSERLRVADVLSVPAERNVAWDLAIPGIQFRSRLLSLEADEPLTSDTLFKQAASDIGSKRATLDELPPTPGELFGGKLNKISRPFRNGLRSLLSWLSRKLNDKPISTGSRKAEGSTRPGLLEAALDSLAVAVGAAAFVAGKLFDRLGASSLIDQLMRNREIDRLMHLLQNDPDEGLRFALPLKNSDSSRGIAPPSNRLSARDTRFSLSRIGRGGPGDSWDVAPDMQLKLMQQYRELALREIRLGRHRRAAYIYAELLDDLLSAAGALEAGQHYREAAVVYEERLKRPLDAARCLERCGLFDKAAELYIERGQFELAAEMYIRLDRREEADQLLRSWVEQLIASEDLRNASRVLHDKLHDVDGAIAVLSSGWPRSSIAQWCLQELFSKLGLHSRHDDALHRIADLRSAATDKNVTKMAAQTLSKVFADYPDANVRESAADCTQVLVSRRLAQAAPAESQELLLNIRRLAPEDRLLSRDCDRYVRIREERIQKKFVMRPRAKSQQGLVLKSSFSLSPEKNSDAFLVQAGTAAFVRESGVRIKWAIAKSAGSAAYAAGFGNGSLVLQRILWTKPEIKNMRAFWAGIEECPLYLEPSPGLDGNVIVHPQGHDPITRHGLRTDASDSLSMLHAGSPTWVTSSTVALAYSNSGFGWRMREDYGSLAIMCYSPMGEPSRTLDMVVPLNLKDVDPEHFSMLATSQRMRIAAGRLLLQIPLNDQTSPVDPLSTHTVLPYNIRQLVSPPGETCGWLLALFETGAMLVNDDDPVLLQHYPVAEDSEFPCAVFLDDRQFVIAGLGSVMAYSIADTGPQLIAKADLQGNPISVTTTHKPGEFAVFSEDGVVRIFQIP